MKEYNIEDYLNPELSKEIIEELVKENAELKVKVKSIEEIADNLQHRNHNLTEELEKFEDMAKKGLEEFKDVGGCWGCGIQLASDEYFAEERKLRKTLNAIKEIAETAYKTEDYLLGERFTDLVDDILRLIKESEEQ